MDGNTEMDLKQIGREGVHWVHLAQDKKMADACVHGTESAGSTKSEEFLEQLGDYQVCKKNLAPDSGYILDTYWSCNETNHKDQLYLTRTVGNVQRTHNS
jgi:hypothetical protein